MVIVDNASSDGNFEKTRKFVEEKKPSVIKPNDRNLRIHNFNTYL